VFSTLTVTVCRRQSGVGGLCADLPRFRSERSRTYSMFSYILLDGFSCPTGRSILPGRHTVHERALDDLNVLRTFSW